MSETISVVCPMCGVSMKLKDRSKLGKKANCPNCSNPFVLAEATTSPTVPSQPPQRSKSGQTAGQRITAHQQRPGGGSKTGAIIGGGVVAVLLLVGVGLWASGLFSGGENPPAGPPVAEGEGKQPAAENKLDLSYLPADTELFVQLQLADAWQSPLLKQLADMPQVQSGLQEIQQNLGLAPADVASLTVGLSGVSNQAKQGTPAGPADIASAARDQFTAVARLNKSVDAESLKLAEHECKELQHGGKTYFLFQPPADVSDPDAPDLADNEPLAVFLAEPKLIVLGSEEQVKVAITTDGKQTRRAELDFVDPDQQLLIVFVPKEKSALTDNLPGGGGPDDPSGEMALVVANNLQAICVGVNVGSGIELQLQANCTDDKAAAQIKQLLDGVIAEGHAGLKDSAAAMFGFDQILEPVLASLKTSLDAATVNTSATISEETVAAVKQSGPQLMGMLMFSGMMPGNGGNGIPPIGPGSTEAQPMPTNLPTEAPDGLEVSGIVQWDENQIQQGDGKPLPPDMKLWIYLIGKQPQAAIAWGRVKIDKLTADGGRELKVKSPQFSPNDPIKRFIRVERGEYQNDHPQHGVKAVLSIPHPQQPVSSVTAAAGTVSLQVAGEQKTATLKNAPSLVGKPIVDPVIEKAGLVVEISKQGNALNLKVTKGNPFALVKVEAVDTAGKRLEMANGFRSEFNGQVSYGFFQNEGTPADFSLKLTLNMGIKQVDVPFDVADVRVPLPPDAPGNPPTSTDGIPAGLTIAGKTAWSRMQESDMDGKELPPALDVLVTMLGESAKKGIAWGFVKLKSVEGPDGLPLKLKVREFSFNGEPTKEFVRVKRGGFENRHPDDGMTAAITLEHPSKPIQNVAAIEGSVKLLFAKEQKTITVDAFPSRAGKAVSHPDLKPTGLRFKLERENMGFKLSLVGGNKNSLAKVEAVDADGKPLEDANVSRITFGKETYYGISSFGAKVPANAALKLTVNLGIEELDVPFRFENLSVPDLPIK
ncbi:MAG: hypothetical protein HON53_06325 [Planctomycetaceae bacterium]|jgi:hypothetical protein|nr:hypothetical protein [Planctomycetaceae bacterium]MBT6155707.1 hypothetical protein [Planctomycetaceae bacterium]MBT6484990.1 hypothetical protein [Planctomycetaceae bacterium]MBT6497524.1 hypothetical protein [Planctomycetaceae bacterium]